VIQESILTRRALFIRCASLQFMVRVINTIDHYNMALAVTVGLKIIINFCKLFRVFASLIGMHLTLQIHVIQYM
jgi:hypothetical protein